MNKNILDKAITHLKKDVKLYPLIKKYDTPDFGVSESPFKSLLKYIIYQQLSVASAKAIYTRFLDLYNSRPNPSDFQKIRYGVFKNIGLSKQKINYINGISEFFLENNTNFNNMLNNEVYNKLIQVKGIGPWTIDMFLIFTLHRTDILPLGDLGIKKGFKILYKLDEMPSNDFMIEKSENWAPYQSVASMYLWKIVDGDIVF